VVSGTAPEDYHNPARFFARTGFTRAFRDHVGLVLSQLSGHTDNTVPLLMLITQFGGSKTHVLTALYHLVKQSAVAASNSSYAPSRRSAPTTGQGRCLRRQRLAWARDAMD